MRVGEPVFQLRVPLRRHDGQDVSHSRFVQQVIAPFAGGSEVLGLDWHHLLGKDIHN